MGEGVIEERCRPFCCRQLYADLLLPLAKKEDTWHVWVYAHAEDTGGHRTWMSPIAVYPSLLRQSLSLVLELTVSSGRLAGHQGPASLHLSRRHTVVTPCCCTCRLGAEPRSPGLRTHALACQSFSLPSCLLLNHIFFLIWTCLQRVYFQIVSLHLPTSWWSYFLLLSSSAFCMEGTRLQSGSKRWFSRCYIQSYISKKLLLSRACSPVL